MAKFLARDEGAFAPGQPHGDCCAELLAKGLLVTSPREGLPHDDSLHSGLAHGEPEPELRAGIKAGEAVTRSREGRPAPAPGKVRVCLPSLSGSLELASRKDAGAEQIKGACLSGLLRILAF